MAAQPPGGIGRDGELDVHGPRPAQRHHEGIQPALAPVVLDEAEVAPVHLGLLARLGLEAHGRLRLAQRAEGLHEGPQLAPAALVALLLDLVIQLAGVEHALVYAFLKVLRRTAQADSGRSGAGWRGAHERLVQSFAHRLAVMAGLAGNVADAHPLAMQVLDHETVLHANMVGPPLGTVAGQAIVPQREPPG